MGFDYQLVIGGALIIFGIVGMANAMVEERSPLGALIMTLVGAGSVGWAWVISGQTLTVYDVPNAVFRILSVWL